MADTKRQILQLCAIFSFITKLMFAPMNMSVIEIIKLGRQYMFLWPERRELANYFSEYRRIQIGRLVYRYLPSLAVFVFIMQLYFGSLEILPQALVYGLFILSMPVQMLVMLGVKADKMLPPSLSSWYKESVAKINQGGGNISLSVRKPRYFDLAQLLNITYQQRTQ